MPGVLGAVTVALCDVEPPALKLGADTCAKFDPDDVAFEVVILTTVVDAFASAVPWFLSVQLTFTLPPGATLAGLKPIDCATKSGAPAAAMVNVPAASTMSLFGAVPV